MATQDSAYASALDLTQAIAAKKVSPVEITRQSLERMEALEPTLNNFVTRMPEQALDAAKRAEEAVMRGDDLGRLHGLPISVKDLIPVAGVNFTFGSRLFADSVAPIEGPVVDRIKAAGACIIGKTTTSEFGCKAVGDSPLTGATRNPWNTAKTPGGSSCGAASSVAAGVTPFALGTDGGGSIRIPASLSGLFGIKAQFARVPVYPNTAVPTLSHIGPLARRVRDAALLLTVLSGHDRRDPFAVAEPVPDYLGACESPVKGLRIAWSPTLGFAKPTAEVLAVTEAAVKVFETLGCSVDLVETVMEDDPVDMWMAEFYAGVGTKLRGALEKSRDQLDPAVARMLDRALDQSLEAYYVEVFKRYDFREKIRSFFEEYDLLLTPTLPVPAFDVNLDVPPEFTDRNIVSWVYYTYAFNLTGQPAASVPAGFTSDGLPVGLQFVARINREIDIFRAAAAFEEARPWADKTPPLGDGG